MTAIEELFIVSLMCSALPLSPEYAALVRCVTAFFPRRYSYMEKNKNSDVFAKKARASVTYENQSDGTSGEESVKNLITELLRKNIQTCHFNIVQIAFNMGKLAGVLFLTVVCAWYIYTSGQHALKKTSGKCDVCVFVHVDSSKKRKRLRRKIQSQKNSINKFIRDYNDLTEELINAEDAENGTFPWLIDGGKYI